MTSACTSTAFFLGREILVGHWLGWRLGWLDRRTMRERTARELAKLHTRIPNIDARCRDLSGGQRQALAIARASAWCERVLLLDEPTSALGVEQQREVLDLIRRVRDLGTAVILVSHQMPDVLAVCDRITVLRLGRYWAWNRARTSSWPTRTGWCAAASWPRLMATPAGCGSR